MSRLTRGACLSAVELRWRWRRFVVRRRPLLVCASLALSLFGFYAGPLAYERWHRSVLSGRPLVYGQVVVRPVVTPGAFVRDPFVTLEPVPVRSATFFGLVARLAAPDAVVVPVAFSGRWDVPLAFPPVLFPGVTYRVFVTAEGCPPQVAGLVEVGWLASRRFDFHMSSCLPSQLP